MPPRFAYWTIILDGAPTSFRTKERDEILPLFNQLKAKNPGALLKWFSGGRLWDSPEQARDARALEKVRAFREQRAQQMKTEGTPGSSDTGSPDPLAEFRRQHGRPADGSDQKPPVKSWSPGSSDRSFKAGPSTRPRSERPWSPGSSDPGAPRRGKDWRPGGEHRDPRDKYRLPPGESRKRWKERNLGPRGPKPFGSKPGDDRPYGDRPRGPKPFGSKPSGDRPFGGKPGGDRPYGDRPRGPKPFGSKPSGDRPFGGKPGGDRPYGDRPRGPKPFGPKPSGDRPFGGKPGGDRPYGDRPRGPKPFGSKPGGSRSFGAKPGGGRPFGGRPRGPKPPGGPRRKG
jgi:23S rRNA pseudouridine2605 synthase